MSTDAHDAHEFKTQCEFRREHVCLMDVEKMIWATHCNAGGPISKLVLVTLADETDASGFGSYTKPNHWLYIHENRCEVSAEDMLRALNRLAARGLLAFEDGEHVMEVLLLIPTGGQA